MTSSKKIVKKKDDKYDQKMHSLGRKKTKRLKSNNFINVVNHYNYNDCFEDEVEDKVKICETLDEGRICWVK